MSAGRRIALCIVLVVAAAGPGAFLSMQMGFDRRGLAFGIAVFVLVYLLLAVSRRFEAFVSERRGRVAFYAGLWTRLMITVVYPIGMVWDFFLGLIATTIAGIAPMAVGSSAGPTPLRTVLVVLIHGTLSSGAHWLLVSIIYSLLGKSKPRDGYCMRCGYDLRGSPRRCPECGEPVANNPLVERLGEDNRQAPPP